MPFFYAEESIFIHFGLPGFDINQTERTICELGLVFLAVLGGFGNFEVENSLN